jgi:hypothetical protein
MPTLERPVRSVHWPVMNDDRPAVQFLVVGEHHAFFGDADSDRYSAALNPDHEPANACDSLSGTSTTRLICGSDTDLCVLNLLDGR